MWTAHVEWICPHAGVVRVYADGKSYENQDPYEWAATVEKLDSGGIELKGVVKRLELEGRRAIEKALTAEGFTHAEIRRHGKTFVITPCKRAEQR